MRRTTCTIRRGNIWHYRRRVPPKIACLLEQTEIAISLGTQDSRTAAMRARDVLAHTDKVFAAVTSGSLEVEQARLLLRHMSASFPWSSGPLEEVARRAAAGDDTDVMRVLNHGKSDIIGMSSDEQARVLLHLREWLRILELNDNQPSASENPGIAALAKLTGLVRTISRERAHEDITRGIEKQAREPERPVNPLAHFLDDYLAEKQRSTRSETGITDNTAYQARLTARLWEEALGPIPVAQVGRQEAARFKDLLLRLPASHGKSSVRRTLLESVAAADAKAKSGDAVERMSMKTVKRHFSALQQAWKWLVERGEVQANPFSGFAFPGTHSSSADRDEWSSDDLITFLSSDYMVKAASERSRDFWLISLAMWSGMRVEEICRLRPVADVDEHDGVPVLLIEKQSSPLPEWSPKSQAGARAVPVHPMLQEAGLLSLAQERRGQERLVPGLVYSEPVQKYSAQASRQMSHVKQRSGVSDDTTAFHSFRHAVTTTLRNTPPDVLRAEWIDAVLGHKPGKGASTGAKVYLKKIGAKNLASVVAAINYTAEVEAAYRSLVTMSRIGT